MGKIVPMVAVRGISVYPYAVIPLNVERSFSVKAIEKALKNKDKQIFFLQQRDPSIYEISSDKSNFYEVGTVGEIISYEKENHGYRIVVEGVYRAKLKKLFYRTYFYAEIEEYPDYSIDQEKEKDYARIVKEIFVEYTNLVSKAKKFPILPQDFLLSFLNKEEEPLKVGYIIANYLNVPGKTKQKILEIDGVENKLRYLIDLLVKEKELLKLKLDIEKKAREELEHAQKQVFLQQQMKEIQKRLGITDEAEFEEMEMKIKKSKMPVEVKKKALKELNRLRTTPSMSPESAVIRNYLDWLISLPWGITTQDNLDVGKARKILDEDHFGLEDVKERILEYLAVLKLKGEIKGQVLCFVGPPGVGKTSVARSIARALGRKFVRISLGGIKDEAEIRGHRRTYVGALPGKIIQQIRRAGTQNPVFLLDEIDKMGKDFRGDPQAALMEVLDPEINKTFQDHYLEVDFDLSKVLFITTANNIYNIPKPLLDRMEVIEFSSYLEWEKIEIAKRHLIPKNKKLLGIPDEKVEIKDNALKKIISEYTKEAGVRELERVIAKILRKSAKKIVEGVEKVIVDENNLKDFLGVPKYKQIKVSNVLPTGCAYGLAWTEYGGEILRIESVVMPGEGKIQLTGHLGEIIKESALAGFSYIRKECEKFGLSPDFYKTIDLHLHIPEGAIPKDGPSAGIPIFLSILSSLTSKSIPADIASTGEITLSGDILPVGGLKEKIMAAKRNKIKRVIVPSENKSEIEELPKEVKEDIEILFVAKIEDVLKIVFPDFGKKGEESFFISQWAKTS